MERTYDLEVYAIVLGAQESLLQIQMPYSFELKKMKLSDTLIKDEILNARGQVDEKYISSDLSSDGDPEFIFIEKRITESISVGLLTSKIEEVFENIVHKINLEMIRVIQALHVVQDGNIEVAEKFFFFHSKQGIMNVNLRKKLIIDEPISVYDDFYNWNNDNAELFRKLVDFPEDFYEKMKVIFGRFERGYSTSKIDDAYKNLVTLSEMILIGYNSDDRQKAKKQKFANRLAASIATDDDAQNVYDDAIRIYKDRSDETHEGKNENITQQELKILRNYVRRLLLNYLDFCYDKYKLEHILEYDVWRKNYILKLISTVERLKEDGYLNSSARESDN